MYSFDRISQAVVLDETLLRSSLTTKEVMKNGDLLIALFASLDIKTISNFYLASARVEHRLSFHDQRVIFMMSQFVYIHTVFHN